MHDELADLSPVVGCGWLVRGVLIVPRCWFEVVIERPTRVLRAGDDFIERNLLALL